MRLSASSPEAPAAALVDLDGTAISVSSERELLLHLLRRGDLGLGSILRFLLAYATHPGLTLRLGKGWNRTYLRGLRAGLLGKRCDEVSAGLKGHIRPDVAGLLEEWSSAGTRVVLLTASLLPLARGLAEALSAEEVVASRPAEEDGVLTGSLHGPRPWGRRKAELASQLLERLSVSPDDAAALGDSWSDRHILRLCGNAIAVSPDRRLGRLAERSGWLVFEGRHTPWA